MMLDLVINFLREIGIDVDLDYLTTDELDRCFLPKILIDSGRLKIDPSAYIGDVLHEAGHLAIFPTRLRHLCNNLTISSATELIKAANDRGIPVSQPELDILQYCYDDQGPQGWQYAANVHLGLDTTTGFDFRFDSI